ncbi:ABC transporter substrate-binding protein [Phyllobacterium chamaecytisi]|uniref:ABC transporter substrate-binding protein n=1 Tax=Phyllobacterium chamaecytisi TaxID=2876082 RepID=UPI001CCC622C|nr:ABC transporter substrate-binding protein [Phyllobacterium sp. KW56]MBZ9603221.1 ABC transporter substrate-binding protein [Phyllobacterium sp. KW56]
MPIRVLDDEISRRTLLKSGVALTGMAALSASGIGPALADQPQVTVAVIGDGRSGIWASLREEAVTKQVEKDAGAKIIWQPGFTASLPVMEAIRAGGIDFSFATATAIVNAVAAGVPIVPLAAYPLPSDTVDILVASASSIKGPADLRGKRIAHQNGTTGTYSLIKYLEEGGLRLTDVEAVSLSGADAFTALAQGSVDAWIHWQPATSLGLARLGDKFRRLDGVKTYDHAFYVAREDFYKENPDVAVSLVKSIRDTQARVNADPKAAVKVWESLGGFDSTGFEPAVYEKLIADKRLSESLVDTVKPIDEAAARSTQEMADSFQELGVLPTKTDVAGFLLLPKFDEIKDRLQKKLGVA